MSLVQPIIEPQVVLRACKGRFFGTSQEWVAFLYSNRIVFKPTNHLAGTVSENSSAEAEGDDGADEIVISIPRPPMTIGDKDRDILPNLGGIFFAVGRNRDMLAMQYASSIVILSINLVTQSLELQGIWGLPNVKESSIQHKIAHGKASHSRVPSAASLVALAEQTSISAKNTASSSGLSPSSSPGGKSKLALSSRLPPPKCSPDGTLIFVATKNKYDTTILLVLSSFGKEIIRMEVDYLDIMTIGWISDDVVYFVYMNSKFHKKFQVCRLTSKARSTGLFGMGRKAIKPSFMFEMNIPIALDFQPSIPDIHATDDLVFKDCVMLGTKTGGYIRVNHRAGSWEPVLNAKNVVGSISMGDSALIIQTKDKLTQSSPTSAAQFSYAVVSDGTVHALRAQPDIGACLSSKHNIDGDRRFVLKLLHLGAGVILDFKRCPFRLYRYQQNPVSKISLIDKLPVPPPANSKLTRDFLVKTEQGLYIRDPNGDDNSIKKIVDRDTQLEIPLERPGLVTMNRRDIKSMYGAYTRVNGMSSEICIYDESQSKVNKLKTKARFDFAKEFSGDYSKWYINRVRTLHRNVIAVSMTSNLFTDFTDERYTFLDEESPTEWAVLLISFVGSTSKRDPAPPQGHVLMKSKSPEAPINLYQLAGNANKFILPIFNLTKRSFTERWVLDVDCHGKHEFHPAKSLAAPIALDQFDGVTFFTDNHGPLDGLFLAGTFSPEQKVTNVLLVDPSSRFVDGNSVVLGGSDPFRTTIWVFDSNGVQFREFSAQDVPIEKVPHQTRQEQLIRNQQSRPGPFRQVEVSPEFKNKSFVETSSNNQFRALPELSALICRGIGYGVDAEIYIKTPDNGLYAMFRIQNKRLHESLARLEKKILECHVGSWLTDEFRESWIEECQSSTMIAGSAFGAYWQLSEEQQQDLCSLAEVDSELIKRMRPP